MAKPKMTIAFNTTFPEAETKMVKTARIVRRMNHDAADIRDVKMARLREDRFENEISSVSDEDSEPNTDK